MLDVTPAFHPIWAESGTTGRAALRLRLRDLPEIPRTRRTPMREKRFSTILLVLAVIALSGVACNSQPNVSGVWKGSIDATDKQGHNWNGPAELTLNQNGNALTGTLSFTHPQGGRVQVPISSGVISKDAVTFSGQNQFPMGTLELTFHGKVADASLSGMADMTSRSLLIGPVTNTATVNLKKQ
jgi:hypothetical protein